MDTRKLTAKATKEQLEALINRWMDSLPSDDPEMKSRLECDIYEAVNGPHFDEETFNKAVSCMRNADGTKGPHWSESEISDYAHSHGCSYSKFNEWDLAYAMNMAYSDYYGSVPNSTEAYYKIAKAFLEDKDGPEGKAFHYWKAMMA